MDDFRLRKQYERKWNQLKNKNCLLQATAQHTFQYVPNIDGLVNADDDFATTGVPTDDVTDAVLRNEDSGQGTNEYTEHMT